jgi:hypothetical protein
VTNRRNLIVASCFALVAVYAAIALSSLPQSIARQSPERASYFRPPWFNFASKYDAGNVLGFRIGSNTEELVRKVAAVDSKGAVIQAECGRDRGARPLSVAESFIAAADEPRVSALAQREVLCLSLPARRVVLIFELSNSQVRVIRLSFIRNELI